jgi:DNA-directed RNA polymerase specialized sigma24 family protein
VFELTWPIVLALATRWVGPAEADDVAQRTLLKLFERSHQYDPTRDARAWVVAVALWEVRTERRRAFRMWRRRAESAPLVEPVDLCETAEERLLRDELHRRLGSLIGEMSPLDQETLDAFARGERSPGARFRKRLERALARLRRRWEGLHES